MNTNDIVMNLCSSIDDLAMNLSSSVIDKINVVDWNTHDLVAVCATVSYPCRSLVKNLINGYAYLETQKYQEKNPQASLLELYLTFATHALLIIDKWAAVKEASYKRQLLNGLNGIQSFPLTNFNPIHTTYVEIPPKVALENQESIDLFTLPHSRIEIVNPCDIGITEPADIQNCMIHWKASLRPLISPNPEKYRCRIEPEYKVSLRGTKDTINGEIDIEKMIYNDTFHQCLEYLLNFEPRNGIV